jgi:hypothetical protein
MSEFRGSTSIELLQLQRRIIRTVLLRREEIRRRLEDGANPCSPFLRTLQGAVEQDMRRINRLHAAIRIAYREDQRLRVWWRTMNAVNFLVLLFPIVKQTSNLTIVRTRPSVQIGVFKREDESRARPKSSSLNVCS